MKAEELMLGDWVLCHGKPMQIMEVLVDSVTAECWPYEYDDVQPIPITPEILEKNGFVKNEKAKSRKTHTIIDGDVYISWWRNRANIVVSRRHIGLSSNHVNVDAKYVHELQHALRLCGIEKEIEL